MPASKVKLELLLSAAATTTTVKELIKNVFVAETTKV